MAEQVEIRLLAECCRSSFANPGPIIVHGEVDWNLFLRLARFHRVESLAWRALAADAGLPERAREVLAEAAARVAAHNLQSAASCRALLGAFESAGVPLLFLKGLTLGALAYGNPALKAAIDIDLLVDPTDLGKAAELLRNCDYTLIAPRESSQDTILRSWHRSWKESVWMKNVPRLQVDLHTRVADNPRLLPTMDVHSPQQTVDIGGGIRLPTLAARELFAYLAVHGASSAWFRLKWISDFAALLGAASAERIDGLYRDSQKLGAGRAAGQALLLAHHLFRTLEKNPALEEELGRDSVTQRLYRAALRQVTGEPSEPTESRFGTLTIHWTQLFLLPGASYKLSELVRHVSRPKVGARR